MFTEVERADIPQSIEFQPKIGTFLNTCGKNSINKKEFFSEKSIKSFVYFSINGLFVQGL